MNITANTICILQICKPKINLNLGDKQLYLHHHHQYLPHYGTHKTLILSYEPKKTFSKVELYQLKHKNKFNNFQNLPWKKSTKISVKNILLALSFINRRPRYPVCIIQCLGGIPIWNRQGHLSEILNSTPKGDHLGLVEAFCDPQRRPIWAWLKQILTSKRDHLKSHKYNMQSGFVPFFRNKFPGLFQDFSRTRIDFSRALKVTLTPTLPRSQC